ncbi:hypothetical protein V8E36_005983 [Tilletia maclaganii]
MRNSHTKASSRTHLPHHAALHRGSLDQQAAPSHQEHHPALSAPSSTLFAVPGSVLQKLHVSKTAFDNNSPRTGTSTPVPQLLSATSSPQTIYAAPRSLKGTAGYRLSIPPSAAYTLHARRNAP